MMRPRSLGLYLLLVVGLALGVLSMGITYAASDENSTLAQRLASSGSKLTVTNDGTVAVWEAHFDAAVITDNQVQLQVKQIKTKLTYTSNGQIHPVANWADQAAWKTIGIAQLEDGVATFRIEQPLGVGHDYRAVVNPGPGELTTGSVAYAATRERVNDGLPTLYVDTNDGSKVDSKDTSWEGRLTIAAPDGSECASTEPLLTKVSGRGNSTWDFEKVGLNLNLDKKAGLCGLPASKKWALIANYFDRSLLRNSVAMHLGQNMDGLSWTPHNVPVDVYVNGEYRGMFDLFERVDVGPGRVDIPELKNNVTKPPTDWNAAPAVTGGYLLQWDFRAAGDHYISVNLRGNVVIEQPGNEADGSGITEAQLAYIRQYLLDADAAMDSPDLANPDTGWRHYIDERSAVDYYLLQEYVKNVDGNFNTSVFMYKDRDTADGPGKLHLGPLWDFDTAMGDLAYAGNTDQPTGWYLRTWSADVQNEAPSADVGTWFNKLNEDPTFRAAVQARWQELRPLFEGLPTYIDERAAVIAPGAAANFERWNITETLEEGHRVQGSWEGEVTSLKDWTNARTTWLNRQWAP